MVGKPQLALVSTNRFWRDVQSTGWNVNGFQGKPTIATKTGVNANIDIRRLLEGWYFHFTSRGAKPSYISFIIFIIFLISLRRLQAAHFAPPALSSEVGSDDFSWQTHKHCIIIYISSLLRQAVDGGAMEEGERWEDTKRPQLRRSRLHWRGQKIPKYH